MVSSKTLILAKCFHGLGSCRINVGKKGILLYHQSASILFVCERSVIKTSRNKKQVFFCARENAHVKIVTTQQTLPYGGKKVCCTMQSRKRQPGCGAAKPVSWVAHEHIHALVLLSLTGMRQSDKTIREPIGRPSQVRGTRKSEEGLERVLTA